MGKTRILGLAALSALVLLPSCKGTWLMYDTEQKDHLYFQEAKQVHTTSFALIPEDEIVFSTTVYLMGVPSDEDRTYSVAYVPVEKGDTISTGNITYPIVDAVQGEDFTLGSLILPAGETKTTLDIHIHRTAKMLDSCFVRIGLKIAETDDFVPCAADSTRKLAIMSPDFYVYVNDGEPACPTWWRASNGPLGWHWDFGKFYPAKYRLFLKYFHETEETNPVFFNYCVDAYGYYLDDPNPAYVTSGTTATLMNTFWRKAYSSAWAKYVFVPLYNYYKEYYEAHPDDPNAEPMGPGTVNQGAMSGWSDPMDPVYGFFN